MWTNYIPLIGIVIGWIFFATGLYYVALAFFFGASSASLLQIAHLLWRTHHR